LYFTVLVNPSAGAGTDCQMFEELGSNSTPSDLLNKQHQDGRAKLLDGGSIIVILLKKSWIFRGCIWRETKIPAVGHLLQAAEESLHSENKC
jgi:hypothetical protein